MPYYPPASSGGGAPTDATYITQTANASLSAEQAMGALASGLIKNTTTTGAQSIATPGTDYYNPGGTDVAVADGGTGSSTAAGAATNLGLGTGDTPKFTGVDVGNATDATITRSGAGDIAVEGNAVYRAGGTDVPVADGGTGASTLTGIVLGAGTSAFTAGNLSGDVSSSGLATTIGAGKVTNAMLGTAAGEPGAAWVSWTPTLTGRLDDGDWTKACKYQQIGKTCNFRISLTATAAAPAQGGAGEFTISLPVTTVSYPGTATLQPIGEAMCFDANGTRWEAELYWATTTTVHLRYRNVSGTGIVNSACSATVPFTWTTSDEILAKGTVEVA